MQVCHVFLAILSGAVIGAGTRQVLGGRLWVKPAGE